MNNQKSHSLYGATSLIVDHFLSQSTGSNTNHFVNISDLVKLVNIVLKCVLMRILKYKHM